jgi:hypothetical protein
MYDSPEGRPQFCESASSETSKTSRSKGKGTPIISYVRCLWVTGFGGLACAWLGCLGWFVFVFAADGFMYNTRVRAYVRSLKK